MSEDHYPSRIAQEPQWIKRREPVAYRPWDNSSPLTREQIASYDRDGFLVLESVFDENEVTALTHEARLLRQANSDPLQAGTTITEPGSPAIRSVFKIHMQSQPFSQLAADTRLADVARFLLDDEVYIHQSRLNYKPGFRGKEFYWHSDFETWHAEDGMPRMRALSMSILLTPNTPHNGALMLIPGSHREFISCIGATPDDHYKQSLQKQNYGVPDDASLSKLVSENGISVPTGAPGSVVIFDCNTMHGSNSNITPLPRVNAFFVYNAVSNALAAPFAASSPRPDFIAARRPAPVIEPAHGPLEESAA